VTRSSIMRFEELLELWQTTFRGVPLAELLGLTAPGGAAGDGHYTYSRSTLRQRFGGTWWQVSWPAHGPDETAPAVSFPACQRHPGGQCPPARLTRNPPQEEEIETEPLCACVDRPGERMCGYGWPRKFLAIA